MHHQFKRQRAVMLGLMAAMAGSALQTAAAGTTVDRSQNKFSWIRDSKSLLGKGMFHVIAVQKRDGIWTVNSINDRQSIESADEELILARRQGSGWEFIPHFDLTDLGKLSDFQCIGKRPEGVPESQPLDRTKQTNLCDSQLTTSSMPKSQMLGRAAGTLLATVFTGGLGAVALALDKRTNFYPQHEELQKVVTDTRMDELLSQIEEAGSTYSKGLRQVEARWSQMAARVKTRFVLQDASQGFGKSLTLPDDRSLLRYSHAFPYSYEKISQYPTSVEGVAEFAARQQERLDQLAGLPVTVRGHCPQNSRTLGVFNVKLPECPKEQALEDEAKPIEVALELMGVKAELRPTMQVDDKVLRIQLTATGLVIENRSDDFVDIVDLALSVNGKVRTLSGGKAALITVAPQTVYPRANEASRFSESELMDADMRSGLSFANLSYPQAQTSKLVTILSVRYAVDGKQKTLRGTNTATVLDLLRL